MKEIWVYMDGVPTNLNENPAVEYALGDQYGIYYEHGSDKKPIHLVESVNKGSKEADLQVNADAWYAAILAVS